MATKTTKKVAQKIEKFNVEQAIERVRSTSIDVNNFALEATEDLVNETIARTEQWQGIATKALAGGIKLASKQQDIVFDTLESLKGQFVHGKKRFSALVNKN
jgi:hypothetical protein